MELAPDHNLHDVRGGMARLWQDDAEQKGIFLRLDIDETLPRNIASTRSPEPVRFQ